MGKFGVKLGAFHQYLFPDGHRLQQDNDPKHSSKYIGRLFEFHNVYWWKIPAEFPDLNPIENCWGSLKKYLRNTYKPRRTDGWYRAVLVASYPRGVYQVHAKPSQGHAQVNGNPSGY